jgi:hypothetical protein
VSWRRVVHCRGKEHAETASEPAAILDYELWFRGLHIAKASREMASRVKKGRTTEKRDDQAERALFRAACGFYVDVEKVLFNAKHDRVYRIRVRRYFRPNTRAAIFWLKNRRPAEWRDDPKPDFSELSPEPFTFKIFDRDLSKNWEASADGDGSEPSEIARKSKH